MKKFLINLFLVLSAFLAFTGCIKMGPDYNRPEADFKIPEIYQSTSTDELKPLLDDSWWKVFGNPELDQVVADVLKHNLDIRRATARILEVQSQFIQTRANRFPTLDVSVTGQRQRLTINETSVGPRGIVQQEIKTNIDTHSLSFPASFEVDLWGRLARAEEAARADLLQSRENRLTVAQTVVAEAISLYLQIEALERQIEISSKSIETFQQSVDFVNRRFQRGLAAVLDLRQARRILAQSETLLPALYQDLGVTQQRLSVLLGRYPNTRPARIQQEEYFKRMAPVPPGLPSDLLLRRPDIRAAEARLQALNAQIGVAKANRFPRITLTGSLGYSNGELSDLFQPESQLLSLAFGVVQPLFDAGKRKAAQKGAEARYQQGVAEYAKTILTAFSEVEGALLTRKEQMERREKVLIFLKEARATQQAAERRYVRGLADYLSVLDAQQTRFQAEQNLVQVDLAILANRVALHRALGGGWGEPPADEKILSEEPKPRKIVNSNKN
ncbi:efflux transporter outer membrane subunit [Thermodesulfobacteriota bacterium]